MTGAAGHLGRTLVNRFLELQKNIRILVLPQEKHVPSGHLEVFYGDVTQFESLIPFFECPKDSELIVIHCAGIVSITSTYDELVYKVNVIGTRNIVNLCFEANVKRLIYVSSVHALPEKDHRQCIEEISYFNPKDVIGYYAKTKSEASAIVLDAFEHGLKGNIIHPSGIIGPNDYANTNMTALIIDYMQNRLKIGTQGGYDFVDVRDVANGIINCISKGKEGECYILSNRYYSVKTILETLYEISLKRNIRLFIPLNVLKPFSRLVEAMYQQAHRTPLFTPYSIYTLQSNSNFSHKKADHDLDYNPRDLRSSLIDMIAWLKENKRI